jgi:hypothetical protein
MGFDVLEKMAISFLPFISHLTPLGQTVQRVSSRSHSLSFTQLIPEAYHAAEEDVNR